jgi:hypothetical protein
MTTTSPAADVRAAGTASAPAVQAFWTLRVGFAALPVLFGADKFAHVLTNDWTRYLAPAYDAILPGDAALGMQLVGVVEIVAGVVVLVAPRIGGPLVAAWLAGIVVDLLLVGGYGDVALRDVGLLVGAIALSRLAWALPGHLLGLLHR